MQQADSTASNIDFDQHSRADREKLLVLLKEKERRINSNQILTLYPETGPLRRELYVPHMAFFEAGKKYKERCIMAANRCISPWTPLEMDRATRLPLEILGEQEFCVRSWDGETRCNKKASGLFLKGISPAFRVYLDNGSFFDCSYKHRILTTGGWFSFGQIVQASDGLHYRREVPDCPASYDKGNRLNDELLQWVEDTCQELFPLQGDVRSHDQSMWQVDVAGQKYLYSHVSKEFVLLSNQDDHSLIEDLCEQFEDPSIWLDAQHKSDELRELRQFADELFLEKAKSSASHHQFSSQHASHVLSLCPGDGDNSGDYGFQERGEAQFWSQANPLQPNPLFCHDIEHIQIFFPCNSSPLVGGQKIDYIVPIGYQPILDFGVEDVKCYSTGGVVHHNSGKTVAGGYELTLHLTGRYPAWWKGKRFERPIRSWACGTTGQTVRDVLQRKLIGPINDIGTGLIPGDAIIETKKKAGSVPDTIETVYVRHISGGVSTMAFKSYEQGRKAYEGDEQNCILLDEEPPVDIYTECLTRTMTTQGIVMLLFTPLQGLSDTVMLFMPGGQIPAEMSKRFVVQASWDEAPHLSQQDKDDIISSYSPHERDARSKGVPQLGSGRIYPIPEEDLIVDDFAIPEHWIQAYGFDVGWKATAAVWGALNRESDVLYLHSCYKQGEEKPIIHAASIKARGEWIPGLSDPAALGRGQRDGKQLMIEYNELGLKLVPAENPVEAGILKLYKRMTTGRLKVFRSMVQWFEEFRIYRRDEKGKIVKDFDHIMDCLHPNTHVITSRGRIKIKDLVDTEGLVLSTDGEWLPYENCKRYGQNKPVVEVLFDGGSRVVCTPDHKILTSDGWVEATDLQGKDCYNAISYTILETNKCKSIRHKLVQKSAGLKCLAVKDAGKSDVYCLEVPGSHAFAVESGVMVHNCSRYLNNSIVSVGKVRPTQNDMLVPGANSELTSGWAR